MTPNDDEVSRTLEARYRDLKNVIASRMRDADAEAVDEVVCDTIIKALRLRDRFDPMRASCWTWLCAIAFSKVADWKRKKHRRAEKAHIVSLDDLYKRDEPFEEIENALILSIDLERATDKRDDNTVVRRGGRGGQTA